MAAVTGVNMSVDKKTTHTNAPLVVVAGPTASGKSAVAMQIARDFGGEIICADSRTIYTGMDIGTAKPTAEDRAEIPHWGLDQVNPGEPFSAADFKEYTLAKIADIRSRGAVPLLVGGTGLYIDGVIFDYQFSAPNLELREQLNTYTLEELKGYCKNNNIPLPENENNRRYVQRAAEQGAVNTLRRKTPLENTIIVGITTESSELRERMTLRAQEMFEEGVVEEGLNLAEQYGWDSEAMTGNVYPLIRQYKEGILSEAELKEKFITSDWRLAKRQRTWLKRNPFIQWKQRGEAYDFIAVQLVSAGCSKK